MRLLVVSFLFACKQEYYQSDRPTPAHYRHSQSDLTEWDESNHNARDPQQRRSGGNSNTERDAHYPPYRNGSREKEEWDENERARPRYVVFVHWKNKL